AHAHGVVHRDIKPDNVLLSGGAAVVTDFGIAKAISASRTAAPGATLTQLGTSLGTPAYMAPEQVAGDPNIDHRVDLYALGCMAFEILTGQQPFANRTPQKMLAAHLSEAPPSIVALRGDTPPALAQLVGKLLEKDPGDRPQSAGAVLQALDVAVTTSAPTMAFSGPGMFRKALLWWTVATIVVLLCTKAAIIAIGLPDWVFPGAIVIMALGLPALAITAYVQRVARHTATATPTLTPGGTMAPKMPSGTIATMAMKASPHLTWRRTRRGGVIAVGGFVVLVLLFMITRALGIGPWGSLLAAGKFNVSDKVLLADLSAESQDSSLAPVMAEAVRAALSQSNAVHVVDQADVATALQEMKRPRDTRLDDPTVVQEVAARTNAKAILGGRLVHVQSGYLVSLNLTATQGGAMLASYQATAKGVTDLLNAVDGITRKLRGKVGESLKRVQHSIPLERATTTSLEALRLYSDAVVANDVDQDYPRAVQRSRQAVAIDTTFALAWRKLAVALHNSRASTEAVDSAIGKAFRYSDRLPDLEKYLVLGEYYESDLHAADRGKALAAYQNAYAIDSTNLIALNELGRLYGMRQQSDSSLLFFRREFQRQPNLFTAGAYARAMEYAGSVDSATALLDSVMKATPAAATSQAVQGGRAQVFVATNQWDSAGAVAEILRRSRFGLIRLQGLGSAEAIALRSGQLTRAVGLDSEATALRASLTAGPPLYGLAQAQMDITFRGRAPDGVAILDAIVAGSQWAASRPNDRPYDQVVHLYALAGKPDRARAVLEQNLAIDPGAAAPDSRAMNADDRAEIALA
ncbi:MAG: protein kinase domain-containing protein, partial [Gemmatimonadales bacterium]